MEDLSGLAWLVVFMLGVLFGVALGLMGDYLEWREQRRSEVEKKVETLWKMYQDDKGD